MEHGMMNYSEGRRIIRQAIRDNKLVVFVGAGASAGSGVPLWGDAVAKIREHLENTSVSDSDYLIVPQLYFNARGEKEYNELMHTIFRYDDKNPNSIHKLIVKLNPCSVITTNYDDFIERSFLEEGELLKVIEKDNEIPYAKTDRLVIKMHGGFTYNNFVLKEDDYLNYSYDFPLIETYVKALMAKNVVLFIGYSYNDPDTKQIMTWVKRILGGDHQRAYMIESSKPYDSNIEGYYKNLGVNVLYAMECDEQVVPCWEYNEDKKANDPYQNTLNLLNHIITDKDNVDIISSISDELQLFIPFNHIMTRYITPILNKHISDDIMPVRVMYNNLIVADPRMIEVFEKLDAEEYKKNEKLTALSDVISKSLLTDIYSHARPEDAPFSKHELIYTLSNEGSSEDNKFDFFNAIDNENLIELRQFVDKTNLFDVSLSPQELLKIPFAYYKLKDYEKCLHVLKNLSSKFLKENDTAWHFICEYNRYYVGRMHVVRCFNKTLADEAEKINPEQVLAKTAPDKRTNRILKDLLEFKLMYMTLSDMFKKTMAVEKDANTIYAFNSNLPAILDMESKVLDFYFHVTRNYIMVDDYAEVVDIYTSFINAVFYSHSKVEQTNEEGWLGSGKNVVLKELTPFMVMVLYKYIDIKKAEEMIKKYSIKVIRMDTKAEEMLFEIFKNVGKAVANDMFERWDRENILIILKVLSYVKISKDRFAQSIIVVKNIIERKLHQHDGWRELSSFVFLQYKNNKESICAVALHQLIISIVQTIQHSNVKLHKPNENEVEILLRNCCFIISELDKSLFLDDSLVTGLIMASKYKWLMSIYPSVSDNMKKPYLRL